MDGTTTARQGFFPVVTGRDVHLQQAGSVLVAAANDLTLREGGGQWMAAGRRIDVAQGGAAVVVAPTATVRKGVVGVLVGKDVTLHDSRVLLSAQASMAVGVAVGLAVGAVVAIRLRRRRARADAAD